MTITTRALATVVAAAALASSTLVPAQAAPAPVSRTPVAVAAAAVVTPPTAVTRGKLTRIFARATRHTDAALLRGAALRVRIQGGGQSATTTGRTRGGDTQLRDADGVTSIIDGSSGSVYVPLSTFADRASADDLAAALLALGKPDASWVVLAGGAVGSAPTGDLTELAARATHWTWKRSKGLTTWTLTGPAGRGVTFRSVVVLDKKQRVVSQSETRTGRGIRGSESQTVTVSYRHVSSVVIPATSDAVQFGALLDALLDV